MRAVVDGVRIAGVRSVVPAARHSYVETPEPFSAEEAAKLLDSTGVHSRRILPRPYCISDLCLCAAEGLLHQLDWDPASVDVLIFVSQDADYVLPTTACVMQPRLGLPRSCAAFDVPLGCSGYIYGLWMAGRLLGGSSGRRALVLAGDNSTRYLRPDDRSTLPLFGDAGTATALEAAPDAAPMPVVVGTDGTGAGHIFVKAGGKRDCLIPGDEPWTEDERRRLFRDARLHLNGAEVFAFSLRAVPPLLRDVLEHAGTTMDAIDRVVLHQANKFMLEHLRKRTKIPAEKFVVDMHDFGNTSSATIPLALCHRLSTILAERSHRLLMAGFGVGWSWGALITEVGPIAPPAVTDLPDGFEPLAVSGA